MTQTLNGETEFLRVEALEINLPEVFFDENGCLLEDGGFDVIIGNPPWEVWESDSDEFFSSVDTLYPLKENKATKNARQATLFSQMPLLKDRWEEYCERYKKGSKYFWMKQTLGFKAEKLTFIKFRLRGLLSFYVQGDSYLYYCQIT